MKRLHRPNVSDWRHWSWDDYLTYFLCLEAAKARARQCEVNICKVLGEQEFRTFCEPIRALLVDKFSAARPIVSIQMPARNDAMELLATLVSYTLLEVGPGTAELIVADNASTDETPLVIEACGVRRAYAAIPGMGKARRAAFDLMSRDAEFVWLTDSDARTVPPMEYWGGCKTRSSILTTNLRILSARPDVVGLSTGIVYEYVHPMFAFLRRIFVRLGRAPRIHAWTGPNQFIRRPALDAIGGIHPDIPYRCREDHQRMYELARYAKPRGLHMLSAASDPTLYDPVYHSGRNRGTFLDIAKLAKQFFRKRPPLLKDRFGWPVHPLDRIRAE